METMATTIPARIQQDGSVKTMCPSCGMELQDRSEDIETPRISFQMTCSCGHSFPVLVELRKANRRETNLSGTYHCVFPETETGVIFIRNISMTGIGFITVGSHSLRKGHELKLQFTLDDEKNTEIETQAVVRQFHDKYVGCEFRKLFPDKEEKLADYLMLIP